MRKFAHTAVRRLNVVRPICNHLVGKDHSFAHRAFVGVIVMAAGVAITLYTRRYGSEFIEPIGEVTGAAVHGFGLTPLIEKMMEVAETEA